VTSSPNVVTASYHSVSTFLPFTSSVSLPSVTATASVGEFASDIFTFAGKVAVVIVSSPETWPLAVTVVWTTTLSLPFSTSLCVLTISNLEPSARVTVSLCVTLVPGLNIDQLTNGGLFTISSGLGSAADAGDAKKSATHQRRAIGITNSFAILGRWAAGSYCGRLTQSTGLPANSIRRARARARNRPRSSDIQHFDYDYAHEHRFVEHDFRIAGQSPVNPTSAQRAPAKSLHLELTVRQGGEGM